MKKLLPLIVTLIIGTIAAYGMWELSSTMHAPAPIPPSAASANSGEVQIGGPFTLTGQNGNPITDADFRGKLMLVYFGFTYCPDVCPTDISIMAQAMQLLGDAGSDVAPIFITIDPERDTQEQLKSYLSNFKPHIIGLTGEPASINATIKAYRVYAQKVLHEDGGDYTMDHSAFMYLMSKDGKYLTHFAHNTPPAEIAAKIREYL